METLNATDRVVQIEDLFAHPKLIPAHWRALRVSLGQLVEIIAEFYGHVVPLTHRDAGCLSILAIEGRLLRGHIPDNDRDQEAAALYVASFLFEAASVPNNDPRVLHSVLGSWMLAVHRLRDRKVVSPRQELILRLYDQEVGSSRTEDRLEQRLVWAIRSAKFKAGDRSPIANQLTHEYLKSALAYVHELKDPFSGMRKGRFKINWRAVRDLLVSDLKPAIHPDHIARLGIRDQVETLRDHQFVQDLREVLESRRWDLGERGAIGWKLGQNGLLNELSIPGIPAGGFPTAKAASAATGLTRDSIRAGAKRVFRVLRKAFPEDSE